MVKMDKKHFIAVIGVSGAGKTQLINDKFENLPVWDSVEGDYSRWVFHDKIFFEKAVLHISGFEDIVMQDLIENTINKNHSLEVYYLYLDSQKLHYNRVRERALRTNDIDPETGLDVSQYAISVSVISRTKRTMYKFIEEYKDRVKFHIINNSKERKLIL